MRYVTLDVWVDRGRKGVNGGMRKCVAVVEKRGAFEEWLQKRYVHSYDRYRAQRAVVKQAGMVAKKWQIGDVVNVCGMITRSIKICFGKRQRLKVKGGQARDKIAYDISKIDK